MSESLVSKKKCLGVTMRVTEETAYEEVRDAIDQRWIGFLRVALPEYWVMLVPNDKEAALALASEIDGLLLTGGNDLGSKPDRDEVERVLLGKALARNIPVLGICRGMQLIVDWFGGKLVSGDKSFHCGTRHKIEMVDDWFVGELFKHEFEVNSYHNWCVKLKEEGELKVLFQASDGSVEAVVKRNGSNVLGMMWHPEREEQFLEQDITLFRKIFLSN